MQTELIVRKIEDGELDEKLADIYVDLGKLDYQKKRYVKAVQKFEECYGAGEVELFSAPGRSEVGGNHTDHQHGEVLAASINLDTIGVVKATCDNTKKHADWVDEWREHYDITKENVNQILKDEIANV